MIPAHVPFRHGQPFCFGVATNPDFVVTAKLSVSREDNDFIQVPTMNRITPPCRACRQRQALLRGLCGPCLYRLDRAVRAGRLTWEILEKLGVALPLESSHATHLMIVKPSVN